MLRDVVVDQVGHDVKLSTWVLDLDFGRAEEQLFSIQR